MVNNGEVIEYGGNTKLSVTPAHVETIKNTIALKATDEELNLFIYYCQTLGVHPLDKMIHFVKRGSGTEAKATFQASIDFLRSLAQDSKEYNGQDEPEFEFGDNPDYPSVAKVKVYRKGIDKPFIGIANWKEFCPTTPGMDFMWKKMPKNQLAKCAEAQALRKAFPKQLKQLYTPDEMAQADNAHVPPVAKIDSVKPAPPTEEPLEAEFEDVTPKDETQAEETAPAPMELSTKDKIRKALLIYTGLDVDACKATLKEVSTFTVSGKEKYAETVDKLTDKWAEKVWIKLQKKIKDEPTSFLPENCSMDPGTCDNATFEGDTAKCTFSPSVPCPYGIGRKF